MKFNSLLILFLLSASRIVVAADASGTVTTSSSASLSSAPPTQEQQKAHAQLQLYGQCEQYVQHAVMATQFTPAETAQVVTIKTHYGPARVLGTAFTHQLEHQVTDYGQLDPQSLAVAAQVKGVLQHHLTVAGHPEGLATKADVQEVRASVTALAAQMHQSQQQQTAAIAQLAATVEHDKKQRAEREQTKRVWLATMARKRYEHARDSLSDADQIKVYKHQWDDARKFVMDNLCDGQNMRPAQELQCLYCESYSGVDGNTYIPSLEIIINAQTIALHERMTKNYLDAKLKREKLNAIDAEDLAAGRKRSESQESAKKSYDEEFKKMEVSFGEFLKLCHKDDKPAQATPPAFGITLVGVASRMFGQSGKPPSPDAGCIIC